MSRMPDDGRTAAESALSARGSSADSRRAGARPGRIPKNGTTVLVLKPHGRSLAVTRRHRKTLRAIRASGQPTAENVENLAKYRPRTREYEVSLTFSGQAAADMNELMSDLDVDTPSEVIKHAIPLLLSARGKEILLRDPKTGTIEIIAS